MEQEILDSVMQNVLDIDYNTVIVYNKEYKYFYDENGLNSMSHKQGYPCDYVIVGLLLEKHKDIEIIENIDYKACWKEMEKYLEIYDNMNMDAFKEIEKKCRR